MKYTPPQRPAEGHPETKPDGQQHRTGSLHNQCPEQNLFDHGDNITQILYAKALGHDQPLFQANPALHQHEKQGQNGHKAQTANLNQAEHHNMAKGGPVGACIHQRQPGDAGAGGGRKQCRQKRCCLPAFGCNGQSQHQSPNQNNGKKHQYNDLHGRHRIEISPQTVHQLTQLQHSTPPMVFSVKRHRGRPCGRPL